MEVIVLIALLWAWEGNLWEEVDPEPETPVVEQSVPDNAVDVTQVTQTAAVLTAVAESLTGTSTATSTQTEAEIEAQIIEELENMDVTTIHLVPLKDFGLDVPLATVARDKVWPCSQRLKENLLITYTKDYNSTRIVKLWDQ